MYTFRTIYNKHDNLVATLLLDNCPELDLRGGEKMILDTCLQDLYLYSLYLIDSHLATDPLFLEYFSFFVLHHEMGVEHETQPILTGEQEIKYDIDCEKLAKQLVDEWWKKFLVRTQIKPVLSKDEQKQMMWGSVRHIFTPEEKEEIHHYLAVILLKQGERCFINMMIDNLMMAIIMRINPKKTDFTTQDKVQLVTSMGFEAKRMTEKIGPLVFLIPNAQYYKANLREWRGDGEVGQVL